MHSSKLRGSDFDMQYQGQKTEHSTFFSTSTQTDRLGLFAPLAYDGVGALTLLMAYVTAFYDCYRAESDDFFAYPDFFSFQRSTPIANYSMCDIWPQHKNVHVSPQANETAAAITDRGVNMLLVPNTTQQQNTFEPVQQEALRRNILRCFLYAPNGQLENPDLTITCASQPFTNWTHAVFNSLPKNTVPQNILNHWPNPPTKQHLSQSFREIPLEQAIQYL